MVCPYPLFHMGAWTIALQQWQARDGVIFVHSADAVTIYDTVERHQAPPAQLRSRPSGGGFSITSPPPPGSNATWHRSGSRTPVPRPLPSPLLEAIESSAARCRHSDLLWFDRGRQRGLARRTPTSGASPEVAGFPLRPPRSASMPSGELWAHGPLLFDGYFFRSQAPRPTPWLTAGTARVTWPPSTPRGTSRSSGERVNMIRTGGETVAPVEVEAVLASHMAAWMRRGRGRDCRIRIGARSSPR